MPVLSVFMITEGFQSIFESCIQLYFNHSEMLTSYSYGEPSNSQATSANNNLTETTLASGANVSSKSIPTF
jgi:hypothetical protein